MRATASVTWFLLLSVGFLSHGVSSSEDDHGATSVSKEAASVNPVPAAVPGAGSTPAVPPSEATAVPATGAAAAGGAGQTNPPAPVPTETTAVATTPAAMVTAPAQPTLRPVPATVPDGPATSASPASGATPAGPDATSSLPVTAAPAAGSRGPVVTSPEVSIVGTPEAPLTSKTTGTVAPAILPENTGNEGTTTTLEPTTSTEGPTTGPDRSVINATVTPETRPEASEEAESKQKVTASVPSVPSQEQAASSASEPTGNTGNTGATITPSALTKAGPPAAETLATQAGTTAWQTTPNPDLTPTTSTPTIKTSTTSTPTIKTSTTSTPTIKTSTTSTPTIKTSTTITAAQTKTFLYSLNAGHEREEEKELVEVCRRLMANLQEGNCSLTWRHRNGKLQFDCVEINGKVTTSLATQYYEEITMKPTDNKTLIAILASCGALLIMIVILAVCASHHRKPYGETQQHLTEELHTVENGYHDNPTLEVMEVQPEMQEKKAALNGEFNDSWIVPMDNLLKEDAPDEEDTHL